MPLVVNDRVTIPDDDLSWTAVRAAGPGGQNVNKVASKIDLRFDLAGTRALDDATKERLRALDGARLDADGRILVSSQLTRDQRQNLDDAREKLRSLVLRALIRPKARRPTRPTRGSKERRLGGKRERSEIKQARGRKFDAD